MLGATPQQTVGPYFKIGLTRLFREDVAGPNAQGERISIEGRVLDANGEPVPDAMLEVWQADTTGRYPSTEELQACDDQAFLGYGRVPTDENGAFHFKTIKPGAATDPAHGKMAPHINVAVFMRGLLKHLVTRIYFPDETANDRDPILSLVPADRRDTLIPKPSSGDRSKLHWDVILQGESETVFFDW